MNVNGIGPTLGVGYYQKTARTTVNKVEEVATKDRIEISKMAKAMTNYSIDSSNLDHSKKIEQIKNEINNGTYNVDSKLTAQSIIDNIREIKEIKK